MEETTSLGIAGEGVNSEEVELLAEPINGTGSGKWDLDDKDVAMVGIVILCIVGGGILAFVSSSATAISSIFTGGVVALGSLASGRKK